MQDIKKNSHQPKMQVDFPKSVVLLSMFGFLYFVFQLEGICGETSLFCRLRKSSEKTYFLIILVRLANFKIILKIKKS